MNPRTPGVERSPSGYTPFPPMALSSPTSSQRQRRVRLERSVSLKFKDLQGFATEVSENISLGGMFLRTDNPQPPGALFDFELTLEDEGPLIQGIGEVVWVREEGDPSGKPAGAGVRFLELAPGSRALIYQVVDRHISRGGQPFDLHERAPSAPPETPPIPELPPEPRAIRAGSYAVLASVQRRKDEDLPRRPPRKPYRQNRRASRRWRWAALLTILVLGAAAVWFFGWREGEPEQPAAGIAQTDGQGTDETVLRDPLADVVPMDTPAGPQEEPPVEIRDEDSPPGLAETGAAGTEESPGAEPVDPAPAEPEPVGEDPEETAAAEASAAPPSPAPAATPTASATVLRDITWQRRGEALEITLLADGPFREGWNHFRMDEGTSREVVRLIGIREPFRPTVPVGEPELSRIRTGHHRRGDGDELHVVLDLGSSRVTLAEIVADGRRLRLVLVGSR